MIKTPTHLCAYLAVIALTHCASNSIDSGPNAHADRYTLPSGIAAKVGSESISVEQVRELSEATQVSTQQALSSLVFDALFAAEAKAIGADSRSEVHILLRATLARALINQMRSEAEASEGTDQEIDKLTEIYWLDLDRPVSRRSVHAVVLLGNTDGPTEWARARNVAGQIAKAVSEQKEANLFVQHARAVDTQGTKVEIQELPFITADGRVADTKNRPARGQPPMKFDPLFAKAVFELGSVGDQCITTSSFGVHVIMLVEEQEPRQLSREARRETLLEEAKATRVRDRLDSVLALLLNRSAPVVSQNSEQILSLVSDDFFSSPGQVP